MSERITKAELLRIETRAKRAPDILNLVYEVRRLREIIAELPIHMGNCPWPALEAEAQAIEAESRVVGGS